MMFSNLYSLSEYLAKKKLLHVMFSTNDPQKYAWCNHPIEISNSEGTIVLEFPFLDILTFDDDLDLAFLNLIDQTISLYEEYQDHYDSDSDELIRLFESFLNDLDTKYQVKLDNTLARANTCKYSKSGADSYFPTYAGI